jgi:ribosomal protein L11 methyltransferase
LKLKTKSLWEISIMATPEAEDAVGELLSATFGRPASAYDDIETGISIVTVYLQQKLRPLRKVREEIFAGLKRIKSCGLRIGSGKIVMARVRHEDWAESWKRHFKPVEIIFRNRRDELCESPPSRRKSGASVTRPSEKNAKSLLIKPTWSKRRSRKGQAVIVLDSGLSFGTGHHPTTAFCLGEIVRWQKSRGSALRSPDTAAQRPCQKPPSFLDLGTGSGILAIAAAKLGYSPVHALDFDPEAVRVARVNARANRVHHQLKIRRGDVTKSPMCPRQRYDLVCANLTSNLLIAERRRIAAQLSGTGTLVLAGILKPEFAAVQKAYAVLGLELVCCRTETEWCSGSFRFGR